MNYKIKEIIIRVHLDSIYLLPTFRWFDFDCISYYEAYFKFLFLTFYVRLDNK